MLATTKLIFYLHWTVLDLLDLEGVDDPHGQVADEQVGDDLAAWNQLNEEIRFLQNLQACVLPSAIDCSLLEWPEKTELLKQEPEMLSLTHLFVY